MPVVSVIVFPHASHIARRMKLAGRAIRNRGVRAGLNEVARQIVRQAKAHVPKDTGALGRSLGHKTRTYRSGRIVVAVVGVRRGTSYGKSRSGNAASRY